MARDRLDKGCWADLAVPGARIAVRVTPSARQEAASRQGGRIAIAVSAPPEDGKANEAVRVVLARALGVAPSRLALVSGATSRNKLFRLAEEVTSPGRPPLAGSARPQGRAPDGSTA